MRRVRCLTILAIVRKRHEERNVLKGIEATLGYATSLSSWVGGRLADPESDLSVFLHCLPLTGRLPGGKRGELWHGGTTQACKVWSASCADDMKEVYVWEDRKSDSRVRGSSFTCLSLLSRYLGSGGSCSVAWQVGVVAGGSREMGTCESLLSDQ